MPEPLPPLVPLFDKSMSFWYTSRFCTMRLLSMCSEPLISKFNIEMSLVESIVACLFDKALVITLLRRVLFDELLRALSIVILPEPEPLLDKSIIF
jgi:hypothetical protein